MYTQHINVEIVWLSTRERKSQAAVERIWHMEDSQGLGFQEIVLQPFQVVPSSLESRRTPQRFRGGLVLRLIDFFVSLNSRLEMNTEEEEETHPPAPLSWVRLRLPRASTPPPAIIIIINILFITLTCNFIPGMV